MPRLFPSLALLLSLPSAPARATGLEEFTRRLSSKGKQTRTLQARFVQRKQLKLFRTEVTTKGKLLYQRPDHLRWETLPPDESLLLLKGSHAELRLPGEQTRRIDLERDQATGALVQQLLVWLGARPADNLKRWYSIRLEQEQQRFLLHLVPKGELLRKRVAAIDVVFTSDLVLKSIRIEQRDEDSSLIEFSAVKRNEPLPKDSFR